MTEDAQALFDLVDAAYAERFASELDQRYHEVLLTAAKALQAGADLDTTRLALYTALYHLPYFRPMTLPPAGRRLYGALHDHYRDYDAAQLRRAALGYGLIVASGTWL
ncbi:bacteriocin immunity protein [Lacticaseibacillus parakribbianus]|uniref:bacteriocin immunity protein n=1 Tax=Lacticaseibacillus parakribbianus TaxID=2970927 RepID=UPI0021CAEC57|nr:bacteriocin immunity protein [Lacticaseibacillus parakribbianus]